MRRNGNKITIKFISQTKKYSVSYVLTMIISLISILISVILPLTMQNIIDKGILQKNLDTLLFYILISVILTVLENLLVYITNIRYAKIRMKYIYDTKKQVLEKLSLLNGRQSANINSAKLMNIIEKDINEIADGLTDRIFLFISDVISASFSLVYYLLNKWTKYFRHGIMNPDNFGGQYYGKKCIIYRAYKS